MRVLIINKFLYPNGGSETYIFKLGEALEQHGHEVQYFGMEHEGRCVGNRVNAYAELVGNKMALLEARSNIVKDLNERGFNFSVKDYAGSNVMSCFELIIKMPFSARRETKKYISNLLVKESIKILPFTGRKKVDIPLLALKCNLQALMIYAVNLGKLFGVQFQL